MDIPFTIKPPCGKKSQIKSVSFNEGFSDIYVIKLVIFKRANLTDKC